MDTALPIHPGYSSSLLECHWAAQLPAAASRLLAERADFSHTNLLIEHGILSGRRLSDGRCVQLDLTTLRLRVGDAVLELEGRTLDAGLAWLSDRLGTSVSLLCHDLPERPRERPFARFGAETQLQAWFDLAQRRLSEIAEQHGGGEVRLWPHHFDVATLIELDAGGGEEARSINVGLSPGDAAYAEPYWYVTPWPKPGGALPELSTGHWHTAGFTAAVMPASEFDSEHLEAASTRFLEASLASCRALLERPSAG